MKTQEFIKWLKDNNYYVYAGEKYVDGTDGFYFYAGKECKDLLLIKCCKDKRDLVTIKLNNIMEFEVHKGFSEEFYNDDKGMELANKVIEYAKTPVDERGEDKKYLLQVDSAYDIEGNSLYATYDFDECTFIVDKTGLSYSKKEIEEIRKDIEISGFAYVNLLRFFDSLIVVDE